MGRVTSARWRQLTLSSAAGRFHDFKLKIRKRREMDDQCLLNIHSKTSVSLSNGQVTSTGRGAIYHRFPLPAQFSRLDGALITRKQ
jgi:hypothetical protein